MFTTHRYCLAQSTPPHLNDLLRELVYGGVRAFFILNPFIRIFFIAFYFIIGSMFKVINAYNFVCIL